MKRYHPLLVALHWLIALLIIVALVLGGPSLADLSNSDPQKIFALTGHMIWGLSIAALMLIRLATRSFTRKPPHADTGNAKLNFGAQAAHWMLYLLVFAMVGSGIGIAVSADLFAIVFGNSGATLPVDFSNIPARMAHGIIAAILLTMIVLHLAGWAYHQFFLRDRLISRMWFGKRTED